ncbi:MAG: DUF4384 domain-containing protein [Bryobacteraceae bacterium]
MRTWTRSMTAVTAALVFGAAAYAQPAGEPQRIRVSVERMNGKDWVPVNPATVFNQGDRVRFHITTNFGGFLYVMNYSTSRSYDLMFPRSDTGMNNKIEANKDYVVPATQQGYFRVAGPPGQDIVYWMVSPVDMGRQYMPLPPPPKPGATPPELKPRCDDSFFKARGECIDTTAGVKPVKPGESLPENLGTVAGATPRELIFIQENGQAKESVTLSSPSPLTGPVVYELRLSHR